MTNLMTASHQWATRPADQRFPSLWALATYTAHQKSISQAKVISSRRLQAVPETDHKGLHFEGPNGHPATVTNWSFGQIANLAGAPAGYLRRLPAELVADCLNYGLHIARDIEDVGILLRKNGSPAPEVAAATGPNYGRVWNADIAAMLVDRFGDGTNGAWRVPGEFRQRVTVTPENTTLYASDRNMFAFLADEDHPIELPNRRAGRHGTFARGFFVWNSEVGSETLGAAFFLYDEVCCNRIIWDVQEFREVRIRHTSSAPDKWLDQVVPVLGEYANSSAKPVVETIEAARKAKVQGDLDKFLATRFGRSAVADIKKAHEVEEGRPIETLWDATTAATAYARSIEHQDARVDIERAAGNLLEMVAPKRERVLIPA